MQRKSLVSRVLPLFPLLLLGAAACSDAVGTAPATPDQALPALAANSARHGEAATQLLNCTVAEPATASAVIGREGGILSAGGHAIAIPRGAVRKPTTFVMTVPASSNVEVDIQGDKRQHYHFARPVVITLDYSRCGSVVDGLDAFRAWYIESNSKSFLGDMGGVDDRFNQRVYFTTDHLSGYAVAF